MRGDALLAVAGDPIKHSNVGAPDPTEWTGEKTENGVGSCVLRVVHVGHHRRASMMNVAAARAVLGVGPDADELALRRAYRSLLRLHHPDVAGDGGAGETRHIIEAYQTCVRTGTEAAADEPDDEPDDGADRDEHESQSHSYSNADHDVTRWAAPDDTLVLSCPADEAFLTLLAVAHDIGDVTYVDRHSELLEALFQSEEGVTFSVVISLQGRAYAGTTEAFFTVEPFVSSSSKGLPDVGAVVDLFARHLARPAD